ncbi:MAG: hypothetical protein CMJ49_09275 [Planctomycetaceae bacterium]|nr:hypothetical protein [Planctomycetaceae bacterium]
MAGMMRRWIGGVFASLGDSADNNGLDGVLWITWFVMGDVGRRLIWVMMLGLGCGVWVGCGDGAPAEPNTAGPTASPSADAARSGGVVSRDEVTFNRDVAPIIYQHCTTCHREGQSAPFTFLDFRDVYKRRTQIGKVIGSGFMPPWQPETTDVAFVGDRRLSAIQIETIENWIDAGGPEGDAADRPVAPEFESAWALGEPDLVVRLPRPYMLQADGTDVFRGFRVPLPITERHYVEAFDFRADNPVVVHHVWMEPAGPDEESWAPVSERDEPTERMSNSSADAADGFITGWVPGRSPLPPIEGLSWPVDPGSSLEVQLHMLPTGKVEPVQMSIALYFADEPPTRFPIRLRLGTQTQDIAPGDAHYKIADWFQLPVDVELIVVMPHAHYLGKDMRAEATLPDNRRIELLHIPDWDFNWQEEYRFVEPISLPAGTTLKAQIIYDNSAANVRNPNQPPRRVVFGPRSSDEMGEMYFLVVPHSEQDAATLRKQFTLKDIETWVAGWKKRVEVVPSDYGAHNRLATYHATRGRLGPAIGHWQEVVKLKPQWAEVRAKLARALARERRYDEALPHYLRLLKGQPGNAALHRQTGLTYWSLGDLGAAAERFGAALAIDDTLNAVRLNLASVLTMQEHHDEALAHLMTVIEREPTSAAAHNGAAWILAAHVDETKRDPARAVKLALKACGLSQLRHGAVLDTLVAACEAAGDLAPARQVLKDAMDAAQRRDDQAMIAHVTTLIEQLEPSEP